jgi:hypothetical protein
MRLFFCTSLLLAGSVAAAEPGDIRMPALGFAFDGRSNQIRPIHGLPGAALLGTAGSQGPAFSAIGISPRHDLALGIAAADRQLFLISLPDGEAKVLSQAMTAPEHIVFSPSGSTAILWGDRIQVLTGLAGSPQFADLRNPLSDSPPFSITISDDARQVILVSGTRDTDPVWQLNGDGSFVQMALPGSVSTVAFRRNTHDAVAVTRSGDVYLIRNAGANSEILQVYIGDEQTSDPVAVHLSPDGTRAFTANARGTVAAIDLGSGSAAAVSCQCAPTGLVPLNAVSLFRLTEISDRPVMLFDASTPNPRVWFVPADAPPAGQQRSEQ